MYDRMVIRLYAFPAFLVMLSVLSFLTLGWFIPSRFSGIPFLLALAEQSRALSTWVAGGLWLTAAGSFALRTRLLKRWELGKESSCDRCGGLALLHENRRGVYLKCLACGSKPSRRHW